MKKLWFPLLTVCTISLILTSCELLEEPFDETFLYGKWRSGTLYYKYLSNGTGGTWDTSDDVREDEAQPFTWTLSGSVLNHLHIMEMGANVPKVYEVTELTATTLKYRDDFGKQFSFVKVD